MRSSLVFHAVDSHTEGMPTRVITGGVGVIPGATMNDRRLHFIAHLDHIRRLLMNEPRDIRRCRARSCSRRHDPTVTTASSTSRPVDACRCAVTARWAWRRCSSRPAWLR